MISFTAPVDDILFSLRRVADAPSLPDWDDELAEGIVGHFAAFAEGVIAPLDQLGDRQGCRLENGRVRMPDGFGEAFGQLAKMGWQGLSAPESFGGMGQGPLIAAMVSEIFSGACHSLQMVCNLVPGAIATLLKFGTETQQEVWIPRLAAGHALSTMCLTESGAGSDLSRIRTRARRQADGWRIDGEKIFISGGDQDMSEDVLHLILARTGTIDDGVKGLSLFLASKSQAGSSIRITRIEEKLGLHASPTCQMAFDATPAELVGAEGEGLRAMFTVMNHARLDVALQGVAHAARAFAIASAYAVERTQGRRADGSDAVLADHADVQRMLDEQRALVLGARAMVHVTLVEQARGGTEALADFLTPVCKVFCTDAGIRAADLGIQILGGYGYLTEYRVGQTWRDARISSIYEGANGIHALATATRGLRAQQGAGADAFDALIGRLSDHTEIMVLRQTWREARALVSATADPATLAHDFTALTATLFYKAIWARFRAVSDDADIARLVDRVLSAPLTVALPMKSTTNVSSRG